MLKGCLWSPGVNGLGVSIFGWRPKLPYSHRFDKAARQHDSDYDKGGDRKAADIRFLKGEIDALGDKHLLVRSGFALLYFWLVRIFGFLYFNPLCSL